jgi:F-type H+-transporting ATPase subunit b
MKVPIFSGKRSRHRWILPLVLAVLFFLGGAALTFASSGGEHDSHAAAGAKGWVATDTYRVMNFAVLFIGLFLVLKKPVAQALGGRIQGIKEQLASLEEEKKAAEAKLAEYDAKMAELDKEAENLLAEYVKQGEDAKARILKEAEAAAEKLKEQASKNIEYEFQQAKTQLKNEIVEKALARAEAIIKDKITSKDQEKLVDEYLAKVVA